MQLLTRKAKSQPMGATSVVLSTAFEGLWQSGRKYSRGRITYLLTPAVRIPFVYFGQRSFFTAGCVAACAEYEVLRTTVAGHAGKQFDAVTIPSNSDQNM